VQVTAPDVDRIPRGNLRVPRGDLVAFWAEAERLSDELESRGTGDWYVTGWPLRAGGWLLKFHEDRDALGEKVVPRLPRTM